MRRLIDADALKEVFKGVYPLATNEMGCIVNKRIYDIIDNAPTIESDDCVLKMFGECSYNETGCSDCLVKEKIRNALANHTTVYEFKGCDNCELERPKGKWRCVGFEKGYAFCTCSECGKTTRLYRDSKNEFCCIADIRKKAVACLYCGARME